MAGAYHRNSANGYSVSMVSETRKRRAWILLLLVWAVIAGVLAARYVSSRRNAAEQLDREAREQEALRAMDKMDARPKAPETPEVPAAAEPATPPASPAPSAPPASPAVPPKSEG